MLIVAKGEGKKPIDHFLNILILILSVFLFFTIVDLKDIKESAQIAKGYLRAFSAFVNKVPICHDCNVILISLDTLRADRLGIYGYFRNTSPNIDAIAEESIVFHNAFANAFFTLPSHMSIFTGLYPPTHGINRPCFTNCSEATILNSKYKTIAELFQAEGYETVWAGPTSDKYLDLTRGFERGFNSINGTLLSKYFVPDNEWLKRFEGIISKNKTFVFMHSYINHDPFIYPDGFNETYLDNTRNNTILGTFTEYSEPIYSDMKTKYSFERQKLMRRLDLSQRDVEMLGEIFRTDNLTRFESWYASADQDVRRGYYGLMRSVYYAEIKRNLNDEKLYELNARYDQGVRYVDFVLGRYMEQLKQTEQWDNTIIIITADHGDELLERNELGHQSFYDELVHVPLIMRIPGLKKRIDSYDLVQSVDILPTVLHLAGMRQGEYTHGRDQIPVVEGKLPPSEHVFGFSLGDKYVRSKKWKYIAHWNGSEELYDLKNDQKELKNLIVNQQELPKEVLEEYREKLDDWMAQQTEHIPYARGGP